MLIDKQYLLTEFDREKRAGYLSELKSNEPEAADLDVYLRLHEFRFPKNKGKYFDRFVKFWLDLAFFSKRLDSAGGIRAAKNEALEFLKSEQLRDIIKTDEQRDTILYDELLNSVLLYFKTCASDSNFNSHAFGLIKLSNDSLMEKIEAEANRIAFLLPEKMGQTEEFSLVTKVVSNGFEIFKNNMKFM